MDKLLQLQGVMYTVRWFGFEGNLDELEKEFILLAEKEGVDLETINEMLEQLYIPPYRSEKLPSNLKRFSGKRERAGRPSLGVTKKVSLTLPEDVWEQIEKQQNDWGVSRSQTIRNIIEEYFFEEEEEKSLEGYKQIGEGVYFKLTTIPKDSEV